MAVTASTALVRNVEKMNNMATIHLRLFNTNPQDI